MRQLPIIILIACLLATENTAATEPDIYARPVRTTEWTIEYPNDLPPDDYARLLDANEIEIGVEGDDGKIRYAKKFASGKIEKRTASKSLETRIAQSWKRGTFDPHDRRLLTKAGINAGNKTVSHYFPQVLEHKLFDLEARFAHRRPEQITETVFGLREKQLPGDKVSGKTKADKPEYEFFVKRQTGSEPATAKASTASTSASTE